MGIEQLEHQGGSAESALGAADRQADHVAALRARPGLRLDQGAARGRGRRCATGLGTCRCSGTTSTGRRPASPASSGTPGSGGPRRARGGRHPREARPADGRARLQGDEGAPAAVVLVRGRQLHGLPRRRRRRDGDAPPGLRRPRPHADAALAGATAARPADRGTIRPQVQAAKKEETWRRACP